MKKFIFATVFIISGFSSTQAQYVLKNQDDVKWYANLPQEEVNINNSASLLMVGESLYYKLYCRNSKTKLLSKNSKIAYVELVGKEGVVFKHRLRLDNGLGHGDFFIPVSVKTGNYKLIGYTRWMLNRADNAFFETDISIVNPYTKIEFSEEAPLVKTETESNTNESLTLVTDKNSYKKRELVSLIIENLDVNTLGDYSLTVRKKEAVSIKVGASSESRKENSTIVATNKPRTVGEMIFLPEFKGEMLTGVVKDKSTGNPSADIEVALSVLSEEAIQDVAKTNSKGVFYFQIQENYNTPRALVQVIGENRMNHVLEIDEDSSINYSNFQFDELKLDVKHKEAIIEQSVNNQIQNAYISAKKDEIQIPNYPKPFYGNPMTTYKLDEYTRFLDVRETLDEVVDHAYHERRNGKTRFINVRERETDPYYDVDILPMVLVDGASVQDHQGLLSFETKDVESMSVLRQEYYFGDKVYQGVLMINTFNKDYYKNLDGNYLKIVDLVSPQLNTKYFKQDYSNSIDFDRIPDYRTQLLWVPNFDLKEKRKQVEFYTSDNAGIYQINLKGFTNDGKPISVNKTFTVNQ